MLSVIASVALAAASPAVAPSQAPTSLPPFTTGYEPTTTDERGLWMQADEDERRLRDSTLTVRDEALTRYLQSVLCRTVGAERCQGVRIYIAEVPGFNASMAPNGSMIVFTGMLLRVRSEAELAVILGHEFAHFELRHSVVGFKQERRAKDFGAWAAVLGGLTNTDTRNLQRSLEGSVYQFSREQEQAADLLGFKYLATAGYPSSSASGIWSHLMAERDASAIGRGQKPQRRYTAGFFDTHPTSLARATYLAVESQKYGDVGKSPRAAELRSALANRLPAWLEAQVKRNDFGGTEYLLQQLAADGWTGELLYARGELYRLRGNPRDIVASVQFYRDALAMGYVQPQVHRNLGMALLRSGQPTDGNAALREYLRLAPDAGDAKAVNALIGNR